jgi:hypothetical protein
MACAVVNCSHARIGPTWSNRASASGSVPGGGFGSNATPTIGPSPTPASRRPRRSRRDPAAAASFFGRVEARAALLEDDIEFAALGEETRDRLVVAARARDLRERVELDGLRATAATARCSTGATSQGVDCTLTVGSSRSRKKIALQRMISTMLALGPPRGESDRTRPSVRARTAVRSGVVAVCKSDRRRSVRRGDRGCPGER